MFNKKETNKVLQTAENEINQIMEKWCISHTNNCSGGEMRSNRGVDIETFVRNTINNIGSHFNINFTAKCGNTDKKNLYIKLPNNKISKKHQLDVHVYMNNVFVASVECKSYLDSCLYIRACDDFKLFRKFDYNIKNYIFTLENSINKDTKIFTDYITENVCDDLFCILDGKRSSSKPIYHPNFKKTINKNSLKKFVDCMFMLTKKI